MLVEGKTCKADLLAQTANDLPRVRERVANSHAERIVVVWRVGIGIEGGKVDASAGDAIDGSARIVSAREREPEKLLAEQTEK